MREGYQSEQLRNLSYMEILDKLPQSRAVVYQILKERGPLTNEEIAEIADRRINCITGRVKELREMNLVYNAGEKLAPSGKKVTLWDVTKPSEQFEMRF